MNPPCYEQSSNDIAAWLRANIRTTGILVAVRHTQGGILRYELGQVVRLAPGRFGVAIKRRDGTFSDSGDTFYFSGKNCLHPKGQTRLVIPTEAVLAACRTSERDGSLPGGPWTYATSQDESVD